MCNSLLTTQSSSQLSENEAISSLCKSSIKCVSKRKLSTTCSRNSTCSQCPLLRSSHSRKKVAKSWLSRTPLHSCFFADLCNSQRPLNPLTSSGKIDTFPAWTTSGDSYLPSLSLPSCLLVHSFLSLSWLSILRPFQLLIQPFSAISLSRIIQGTI